MSGSTGQWLVGWVAVAAAAGLVACGGGGGGGSQAQGTLRMAMTDAPSCYEQVLVTVEKVRVHKGINAADGSEGWEEIVPPGAPVQVDLLNLTNGALADLGTASVDAGDYSQLRLVLAENTPANPLANAVKPLGGALQPLKTPSAQQSGLKIKADFGVPADGTTHLLLDFDACKSVVLAGDSGQYILKPVVRLSLKPDTSIQGWVTTTMTLGATTVSAQQGGTVVRSTVPDAGGKFVLAYLPAGNYDVVVTSDQRATGVVTGVPVGTAGSTVLNGTTTSIVLSTSVMNTVTGAVSAGGNPLGDATVTATQSVAGSVVEVASKAVDFDFGTYTMKLPAAAPRRAPYSAGGLAFTADNAAAGTYTLTVTSPGRASKQQVVDVTGGPATAYFAY